MGPPVTFFNVHPDAILDDSVGRLFGYILMANVDKVRENEDQLSILNAVARHASALATFDPENGEYKT